MANLISGLRIVNDAKPQTELISLCRDAFRAYDEIWVIGPKGDHHKNLVDLGVLNEEQICLVHVHNVLGDPPPNATLIHPPAGTSGSFDGIFSGIHDSIISEIDRIISQDKQVCILMPMPNSGLNRIIREKQAESRFTITAPIEDDVLYTHLESKLGLARLVEDADRELAGRILIPSTKILPSDSFDKIRRRLSLAKGTAVYLQQDISAGGEGTTRIQSQDELTSLFNNIDWMSSANRGLLKASREVRGAYSANGSACIVPIGNGECVVYIDPLSHKPTGIEEMGMTENCGIGNDWSSTWPKEVQKQYIQATTLIGKELYKKWGYVGIFGPDYLVEKVRDKYLLWITEINPRWQGTTPYQTYNALIAQRLPLELVHYALKLDRNNQQLGRLLNLLGDVGSYNYSSVNTKGCFYIKIGAPKSLTQVKNDMNGSWLFDGEGIHDKKPFTYKHLTSRSTSNSLPIIIKSPPAGTNVGGEFVAVGYIIGRSNDPIFSTTVPEISDHGHKLFNVIKQNLYSGVNS